MSVPAAATEPVVRRVRIDAAPRTVFGLLTDPAKLVRWMGTHAMLDARPGGIYRVNVTGGDIVRGEFVEVVPDRRVVFTWGWERGFPVGPGASTVEITLEPDGDGTLLQLVHRDLPADMRPFHGLGWEHVLGRLATVATGADPGPDPLTSARRALAMMAGVLPRRYLVRVPLRRLVRRTRSRVHPSV